jgi:dTDP-4-amino-4,6-dideoxygalactose transaminase
VAAPNTYDAESIPDSVRQEIDRLLDSGDLFRYTSDEAPVALLERDFADFMGVRFALAVSSCSAALFLSLQALGIEPGSKVLIPAFTFGAVPSAVVHANCTPLLVEVGENYRVDMDDFERKLADEAVGAVMISHMRGHTSDMDRIMTLSRESGIPVVEDAAHSLGTTWNGQKIGTIGEIGCFSFQSYKLVNAGEGGMLITDDPELLARAVLMSGAYEYNWRKHVDSTGSRSPELDAAFTKWQNQLPLYNMRMQNLSAAVVRSQIPEIPRRCEAGLTNHDYVAAQLKASGWFDVPSPLPGERRAPDSIQFNLVGFDDDEAATFPEAARARGVKAEVFGLSTDNARAFWNWAFIPGETPELPSTRAMLMRAVDVRLPARLTTEDLDYVVDALIGAAEDARRAAVPGR